MRRILPMPIVLPSSRRVKRPICGKSLKDSTAMVSSVAMRHVMMPPAFMNVGFLVPGLPVFLSTSASICLICTTRQRQRRRIQFNEPVRGYRALDGQAVEMQDARVAGCENELVFQQR